MGRDENRHALIAREIDQQFPETVPCQRIDARGRLVEDENLGLVDDGDGEREPLANPQRQIRGALIEIILEAEPSDQLGNTRLRLLRRQVEKVRVKIEVLPDGQLDIERERLRHVADTVSRAHVPCIEGLSEQERLAFARRQQAGQHFHGRGLAAAVRAEEAEYLAPLDGEADRVDRREITEATGKVAGGDDGLRVEDAVGRYLQPVMIATQLFRKQRNERILDRRRAGCGLEIGRGSGGQHLSGVHGRQPVEPLRFFHIGCRNHHAHAAAARAHTVDQFPELAARERIDAGGRLVEDQQIGIVDEAATKPELLPHAARQFLRRTVGKGCEPGALEKLGDSRVPFGTGLPEQAAEKLDVLADAEVRIKVLAQSLRHIGDAGADRGPMRRIRHAPVEDEGVS